MAGNQVTSRLPRQASGRRVTDQGAPGHSGPDVAATVPPGAGSTAQPDAVSAGPRDRVVESSAARRALAALRIGFAATFLWAFVDKLLALGWHTGWDATGQHLDRFGNDAWIHGGSPTRGFLAFGVSPDNWFHDAFGSIAGAGWADALFTVGLLGIGVALLTGAGLRTAALAGVPLYLLMWVASFPLQQNPLVDDHLLGAVTLLALALTRAGDTWGLGRWWSERAVVRRFPLLG